MALTYSVTASKQGSSPIQFDLKGYSFGFNRSPGVGAFQIDSVNLSWSPKPGDASITNLLDAYSRGTDFDTLTIEIKDDMNRVTRRFTFSHALVSHMVIGADHGGGSVSSEFVFDKIKVETASTPGGPLDTSFETEIHNQTTLLQQPHTSTPTTFATTGDYSYQLTIDGKTVALAGYELDASVPVGPDGSPTGSRTAAPLIVHLAQPLANGDADALFGDAFSNAPLGNARIEVKDADNKIIHSIDLTGASIQAQGGADGTGGSNSVFALTYQTLLFGTYTDPGSSAPDVTTQLNVNDDGSGGAIDLTQTTLATIAAAAELSPGGTITLSLTAAAGGVVDLTAPIVLKGVELDFVRTPNGQFSPLIAHLGGDPTGQGLVQLLDALSKNANFSTATIEFKDEHDVLVKRITLGDAHVIGDAMAGGGGGGDAAVAFAFNLVRLETASTPGGTLDRSVETNVGDHFATDALNLPPLATPVVGGAYTYQLTVGGHTIDVSGYELDVLTPYGSSGNSSGAAKYTPLLIHLRGPDEAAAVVGLVQAAVENTPLGDATLEIHNSNGDLIGKIDLKDAQIGATALATGTGRSDATLALTYSEIDLQNLSGTSASTDIALTSAQVDANRTITADEFKEIGNDAQIHNGNSQTIAITLHKDGVETVLQLDGYEFDLFRTPVGEYSPVTLRASGAPGGKSLVDLLTSFAAGNTFDDATIEVKNGSGDVTQSVALQHARVIDQSLAAGGKGSDAALALAYDQITLTGGDQSFSSGTLHFASPADLGPLTKVQGGDAYTYKLTFDNGGETSITGYELDLHQPSDDNGGPTALRQSKPLVLHFDQNSDSSDLTNLFNAAANNGVLHNVTVEVRDSNNALVNKIVLTDATVVGEAEQNGGLHSAGALALDYANLDFQNWNPADSAATSPAASVQLNAGANVALAALDHSALTADVHAIQPGWVDHLIDEVHSVFNFIRHDAPERALGAATSHMSALADGGGFTAFDAGATDLPPLSDIPIIGDKLQSTIDAGLNIFNDVEARIVDALQNLPDGNDAAQVLADQLNGLGVDGLEAQADGTAVRLSFSMADMVSVALDDIAVSLGTDTFGLDLMADVGAKISAALNLGLQVDVTTGDIQLLDTGGDELKLGLTAGADFTAHGALGVVDITATDNNPANDEIKLNFGLNLPTGEIQDLNLNGIGLNVNGSAKLDLHVQSETPVSLLPTIAGDFVVNWSLPGTGDDDSLTRSVDFNNVTLDLRSLLETLKQVFGPIEDIYNNYGIGTFIDAITQPLPVIDDLARKIGATSLLDFVPIDHGDGTLSLLDVAVLVLKADGVDDHDPRIVGITKFAEALAALDSGDGGGNDDLGLIQLGSFHFAEAQASSMAAKALASLDGGAVMADSASSPGITQTQTPTKAPTQQADEKIAGSDAYKGEVDGHPGLNVLGDSPLANGFHDISGFSLPILSDPTAAVKILFNAAFPDAPVDIVKYDLPALQFAGYYERFFPIVGPIGAVLAGGFNGRVDFAVGYDSYGLANGGLSDFDKGFYVTTQEFTQGSNVFEPIATLTTAIGAGAAINVGVGSAGVVGSIAANLSAYLNDPDMDGKLRFSEFDECLVDPLTGKFTAELSAFLKFGWGPFSWTRNFKIADATLADFSFGCDGPDESEMGGLATLGPASGVAAAVLELNVGDRHNLRHSIVPEYVSTNDEHYAIRNAIDDAGNLIPGALQVGAFTQIETFGADPAAPITIIHASFGNEDDSLVIAPDVMTPSDIAGQGGNDLLTGGGGSDTLYGDERNGSGSGQDILNGNGGDDHLYGGGGDDTLDGGAGADYLDGGSGRDQVSYELSPTGVIFRPIGNINGQPAFAGQGGDAEGDTLVSIEYIIGSHFADQIYGNPGQANTLEGLEGNDILQGGSQGDYILGGPGADQMFGLAGEDGTSYITSNGGVRVDLTTGHGYGGDAEGDQLSSIEDIQGSAFDDTLRGTAAANIIDGFYGDDLIEGRGGADKITAGGGDDTIYALADGDSIDGGDGHDLLSYAHRTTGGVTVNLRTGDGGGSDTIATDVFVDADHAFSTIEDLDGTDLAAFGDNLTGDSGNNRIRGLAGNDHIDGGSGDDVLVGGAGADALTGGEGRDLADYLDSPDAVNANLETGVGAGSDAQGDTYSGIEDLRGSDGADHLTGNAGDNRIDPSLSRGTANVPDMVWGREGIDTLVVDYSRGDTGIRLIGGFASGSAFDGAFQREEPLQRRATDQIQFQEMEKLDVIATMGNDIIYGGGGDDTIITESGNDIIYGGGKGVYPIIDAGQRQGTAIGADRILAGDGDDTVYYGTNENRQLAKDIILDNGQLSFAPFYLDGGHGIDTLSISLTFVDQDVVLHGSRDGSEFTGANLSMGGYYAANFEILGSVYTGTGNDQVTQTGDHDNVFDTGAGQDIITPGLGTDTVHGGTDFQSNFDGGLAIDFKQNAGDLLVLDYSSITTGVGVTSNVGSAFSPQSNGQIFQLFGLLINTGTYSYGGAAGGSVSFDDIERLDVTGSNLDDTLVGTNNWAQNRGTLQGIPLPQADSNETLRGADILKGLGGNDYIVGNNGSDTIDGGTGNDTLVGADPNRTFTFLQGHTYTDNYIDQTEVDTLTGGTGADTFVLGTSNGFFYGYTRSTFSTGSGGPSPDQNRAIITDFNPGEGDRLQLYGNASLYQTTATADGVNLYLKEPAGGVQWIAEVHGVSAINLNGPEVVYGGSADSSHMAALAPVPLADAQVAAQTELVALADGTPASTPIGWITQDANPNDLRSVLLQALSGTGINTSSLTVTLNGHAEAFGKFDGDPFGLGSGLILSTGKVEDLQGPNTEDGKLAQEHSANVDFVKIGRDGEFNGNQGSDIFRADLTGLGFDLSSITLPDSNSRTGGAGDLFSGFDLDAIFLSHQKLDSVSDNDLNNPAVLTKLDAFDFTQGGIVFNPGTERYTHNYDLNGLENGIITDPGHFAVIDGHADADGIHTDGHNALGDGGSISFNLTDSVSTAEPLYLYIAEQGGTGETVSGTIKASDQRIGAVSDLSTDFGEPGIEHDTSSLTFSFDKQAGSSDDTIVFSFVMFTEELREFAGSQFNDSVKILLNGENLAQLSDGNALTVNNLLASPLGPQDPDLILNPVGTGPLADSVRADAYTKTLSFIGTLQQHNTVTIEVKDTGDGALDTGILLKAGTAETGGDWSTLNFNSAPVFSDLDAATTYTSTPVVLDSNASVLDTDLATSPAFYSGATLTVSRLGGPDARDIFGASGALSFSGSNVVYAGVTIGTVANAGGTVSILFNSNAQQAAVNGVIDLLTYASSAPTTEDVNLRWDFSDGNTGAQGLGGLLDAIGATTVSTIGVNHPPIATPDMVNVDEDASTANLVALLLGNDSDPDGNALSILSVDTTGTKGSLTFDAATQTLVYTADDPSFDPLEPGDTAATSFAYTVKDPSGAVSSSTVAVTVHGLLNDDDYIYGTPQDDVLTGGAGNEKFRALAGNDIIYGNGGNDRIEAGPGNDILYGGGGHNLLFGEAGNDTFGNETVASVNLFDGGDGIDTLITRALAGGMSQPASSGSMLHTARMPDDPFDLQPHDAAVSASVTVDLNAGTVTGGYYDGSTLSSIENVKNGSTDTSVTYIGNDDANALTGGLLADILRGNGGNDTLQGSSGDDLIDGGAGADMLGGGAGNDTFVLRKGETNGDRILDFIGNGANAGDSIRFEGFGAGAFLTSSGTTFTVHFSGGTESFTMNTPVIHPTDYVFA